MSEAASNPLLSPHPQDWERLIESLGPASLLVAVEARMSSALLLRLSPGDILQDVLHHLWRDREKLEWRGTKAFRSLVLSILDHRIRDAAAKEFALKRGGGARLDGPGSNDAPPEDFFRSTTPSRIAMAREEADAIRAAMKRLPDDLREIVRLRLIEGFSTQATADRLELGLSGTKHRFLKGARLYRELLKEELDSRSDGLW